MENVWKWVGSDIYITALGVGHFPLPPPCTQIHVDVSIVSFLSFFIKLDYSLEFGIDEMLQTYRRDKLTYWSICDAIFLIRR